MRLLCCVQAILIFCGAAVGLAQNPPAPPALQVPPPVPQDTPVPLRPPTAPPVQPRFDSQDGDRIVFLGDTLMEREGAYGYIETLITITFPEKNLVFRNLGWSADTVLGESRAGFDPPEKGFDKLKAHLSSVKPTAVILGYGMASSFGGRAGLPRFIQEMNTLIDTIQEISKPASVRFLILGPVPHERLDPPLPDPSGHNESLTMYDAALQEIANKRQIAFVSFQDRLLTGPPVKPPVTDNGIHLSAYGYWRAAEVIARALRWPSSYWRIGITSQGAVRPGTLNITAEEIVKKTNEVSFTGKMGMLPSPSAPPTAIPSPFRPRPMIQFTALAPGSYTLKIDGQPVAVHTDVEWNAGQLVDKGPDYQQVEELRQAILKKNELYFHRWRPQNETYLFGFRKYEQGQNAREIPMFDPLVAEQEKKIAEMRKPKPHRYELVLTAEGDREKLAAYSESKPPVTKPVPQPLKPFEQPKFEVAPGFEITLFAQNPHLAKPIQMNFDPQGRLWVASSSVYPQIEPGKEADDKILVLEDTDNDGKADKSTVFADGLLIPTGVEPGDGGVYVGASTELLHFKDTDGDGRADQRRVVLSGFGTEDTHHILHTLRWGHDGQLYMNQSIYIHSHIETPHGVVRLDSGGIMHLRPPTLELGVILRGLVNSWGHHFDRYGQSFATDGAGSAGINYVLPGGMYVTYEGARRILGSVSPGSYPKFCGLEVVESEHFPEDWMGNLVTCDFRAHRVVRFAIAEKDSAYVTIEKPDLARTTDVTFRPIDVKMGPDGALYIADWSNPIIQHGEVDFRDPRRDHAHGRIWRIAAKDRPLARKTDWTKASPQELLDALLSKNNFMRQQARRVLIEKGPSLAPELQAWAERQTTDLGKLEALWLYQALDQPEPKLLRAVLDSNDGRIRAAATRVLSFWHNRVPDTLALLQQLVLDNHPRVRLEAIRAIAKIPTSRSVDLVLSAVERPLDPFQDYAAWLSINELAPIWVETVKAGVWDPAGREKQLEFALLAIEPHLASSVLGQLWKGKAIPAEGKWIELMGKAGAAPELEQLFNQTLRGEFSGEAAGRALHALAEAARLRKMRPSGDLSRARALLTQADANVLAAALHLIATWQITGLAEPVLALASARETAPTVRAAAFAALREIGRPVLEKLKSLASKPNELPSRILAAQAVAALDLQAGAPLATQALSEMTDETEALAVWRNLLQNKGAGQALGRGLPASGLPLAIARAGLRAAREGGRSEPELVLALARTADVEEEAKNLTAAELQQIAAQAQAKGDPHKGELVYRRLELGCMTCHAIGGVGGKVGPDLTSIGASAPLDYLIESLLFPNRKIKEGFHAVNIQTKDDLEYSGVVVQETEEQIVLRDASNKEVSIAKNNVAKRAQSSSLMPSGLVDTITDQERLDLYRFLAELGKPGPFDASKGNVARLWKLLPETLDYAQFGPEKILALPLSHDAWVGIPARVDGSLPKTAFEEALTRLRHRHPGAIYAATQLQLAKQGAVALDFENISNATVWINGKSIPSVGPAKAELSAGTHTIIVKLDAKKLPEFIRLKTSEGNFVTQ